VEEAQRAIMMQQTQTLGLTDQSDAKSLGFKLSTNNQGGSGGGSSYYSRKQSPEVKRCNLPWGKQNDKRKMSSKMFQMTTRVEMTAKHQSSIDNDSSSPVKKFGVVSSFDK